MGAGPLCRSKQSYTCNSVALSHHNLPGVPYENADCRYLPYTVEDITVRKYSDIDIRHQDVVEAPLLLVPEEGVGHPNFSSISHCQVFYSTCKKTPLSIRTFCLWIVDLPLHHLLTLTMLFIHCKTVPEMPDNR